MTRRSNEVLAGNKQLSKYQKGRMNRRLFLQRAVGAGIGVAGMGAVMSGSALGAAADGGQEAAARNDLAAASEAVSKEKTVNILYMARYNGQFLHFDNNYMRLFEDATAKDLLGDRPQTKMAEDAAVHLFGDPGNGTDEKAMESQAGVKFEYFNTLFQPDYSGSKKNSHVRPTGYGWIVVIKDEFEKQMETALDMNDGLLRQMYTIDKIYLNNDFNDPLGTKAVYERMTPSHWS